jgi:hypothetical protein
MTLRYVSGVLTAIVLICGLPTLDPAYAQTRDSSLLPPETSGVITVAGCLQLGGENGDKYLLANPRLGPIASVAEKTCDAPVDERALDLKDTTEHGMNQSMLGHWIEINGRLEKETDADLANLRELEVRSFRLLPVIPPPVISPRVEAAPVPVPRPAEEQPVVQAEQQPVAPPAETTAPPEERPIGTTGVAETPLPQTASLLPTIGLLGLLALAGALGLGLYRTHERG